MTDCADGSNDIITVELAESTVFMAERLGLNLSQLANDRLSDVVCKQMNERARTGSTDIAQP